MRRLTLIAMSTLSALVLLFSYHTSTGATAGGHLLSSAAPGIVSGAAPAPIPASPSTARPTTPAAAAPPVPSATAGTARPEARASTPAPAASAAATPAAATHRASATAPVTTAATRPATPTAAASPSTPAVLVVNGSVEQTQYGPVQVQVRLSGSRITDVVALQTPSDNPRDEQIAAYAVPQLRAEVLAAQSANVDMVSGATYTSTGYLTSLQAALDAAHR